jgi:hypothetical protein
MRPQSKKLVCIAIALPLIAAILLFPAAHSRSSGAQIVITIRTNGIPYVMGIPLKSRIVQNATFRAISLSRLRVGIRVPGNPDSISLPGFALTLQQLQTLGVIRSPALPTSKSRFE